MHLYVEECSKCSFNTMLQHPYSRDAPVQPQHLLVTYGLLRKYVSFIDDDTFPQQRSVLTTPLSIKKPSLYLIDGSSQGLFCFYKPGNNFEPGMVVLWNPSIRKYIVVDVPGGGNASVGFGVCPVTSDPKIVAVTQSWDKSNIEASYQCKVMVYTLSSGKWRSLSDNLPTKPIQDPWCSMVTDRFIYWRAGSRDHNIIMSFDVTSESFEVIALPDCVAYRRVCISKLRDSFVITKYTGYIDTVWMLEHGVQRAFTKFTIETPHNFIVGFTKSGIPLVKVTDECLNLLCISPTQKTTMFFIIVPITVPLIPIWKLYFCSTGPNVLVIDTTRGRR